MIRDIVDAGVIKEFTIPTQFCASSNFIRKPSGRGLRLITDLRPLNVYSESLGCPFWSVVELQHSILPDSCIVWSEDFSSGYYQIPLAEESQQYTANITQFCKFCYQLLLQGFNYSGDAFWISHRLHSEGTATSYKIYWWPSWPVSYPSGSLGYSFWGLG